MTDLSVPHIYKKGKIVKIKTASPIDGKQYLFRIGTGSILRNANSLNNLNEVIGRIYMTVHKIASSFGISKDPTEKVSKETSSWMKTLKLLKWGSNNQKENIKILEKLDSMDNNFNEQLKLIQESIIKDLKQQTEAVEDFKKELKSIKDKLTRIIGE